MVFKIIDISTNSVSSAGNSSAGTDELCTDSGGYCDFLPHTPTAVFNNNIYYTECDLGYIWMPNLCQKDSDPRYLCCFPTEL